MIFVHQFTGDYERTSWQAAVRQAGFIHEYVHLGEVEDPFAKTHFEYMLSNGIAVITTGSHTFQIRKSGR